MWKWYSDVEWTGEWNHTCLWKNEHERRGSRDFGTEMTLFLFCFKKYFQGPFAVETRLVTYQSIALESLYQKSFQSNSIRSRVWPQTRENLEKKMKAQLRKIQFSPVGGPTIWFFLGPSSWHVTADQVLSNGTSFWSSRNRQRCQFVGSKLWISDEKKNELN